MRPQPIREIAPPAWPLPLITEPPGIRGGRLDLGDRRADNTLA